MILHHWDSDGICSAALLMRMQREENFTPKIGNYFLDNDDIEKLKGYDEIRVVDMNLPDAAKICEFARLWIYDHHMATKVECAQEHCNPSLYGKSYPSATLVIMERFNLPFDHIVALGIVGDNGPKTKELKEYKLIKNLEKNGIAFDDLQKAVNLIDSSYKINDRKEVIKNVELVLDGIEAILENEKLNRNVELIEKEIEKWAGKAEKTGKICTLKMKTNYNIISAVTRKIVWENGGTALVLNHKDDRDEIYLRSTEMDITQYIKIAKSRKYFAGGKKEVMGAILPKGEGAKFFEEILKKIDEQHP